MTDTPHIFLLIKFEDYWYKYIYAIWGKRGSSVTSKASLGKFKVKKLTPISIE